MLIIKLNTISALMINPYIAVLSDSNLSPTKQIHQLNYTNNETHSVKFCETEANPNPKIHKIKLNIPAEL